MARGCPRATAKKKTGEKPGKNGARNPKAEKKTGRLFFLPGFFFRFFFFCRFFFCPRGSGGRGEWVSGKMLDFFSRKSEALRVLDDLRGLVHA